MACYYSDGRSHHFTPLQEEAMMVSRHFIRLLNRQVSTYRVFNSYLLSLRTVQAVTIAFVAFAIGIATSLRSSAQTLSTLASFDRTHGALPHATLTQGADGNFYGTTMYGGASNVGTVFKMTPSGTLTDLHDFAGTDGMYPTGALVQMPDGSFYGTTTGGADGGGTVFRITSSGALSTVYTFHGPDGLGPEGLIRATDGNFYGATNGGGAGGNHCNGQSCGTVFKLTPSGTLTVLYSFCAQADCPDGYWPYSDLVQGTDGNFYGTTSLGGANSMGTIFQISPAGSFTSLHSFNGTDGATPYSGLVQGTDGNYYGDSYGGSIYMITSGGSFHLLHSFTGQEGSQPSSDLIQATDGSFYGTTQSGGSEAQGTVFRITAGGTFTSLHSFSGTDGSNPSADLLQPSDGNLYGTAWIGGTSNNGTVFRLSGAVGANPAQFVQLTPCRLVDTRQSGGGGSIPSGNYEVFNLPQLSQTKACGDLSSAITYSLNVTLIPQDGTPVSYLTIWPAGRTQPSVSTMNSLDGRNKANAAIVPAGAAGAVSVFVTNTADVVLDIDGYFAPPSEQTLQFYPLPPCRVADTRKDTFPQGLGTPHLSQGVARDFPVLNAAACNIPASAQAYSLNFTAIPYPSLGHPLAYLEVWPTGEQPQHPVSTLNNPTATYVANAAIVPAGTGGSITAFGSDDTDLAIDINGYFAAPGTGGLSLYPTVPCRVIDTRKVGSGQPFTGTLTPPVDVVGSPCGVPSAAQAYVFNSTVVPSPNLSYLTLWPDGEDQPVVSTLNAADGRITSNMAIVPGVNGKIDAYAAGLTQLILDISSYFAP